MGGFLFLRYLCPSILAPHLYGLLDGMNIQLFFSSNVSLFTILFNKTDPPTPTAQRQLILLGKVLQYLASHALPGVKEEYMQNLNAFIANNQDDLQAFYDDVLVCLLLLMIFYYLM